MASEWSRMTRSEKADLMRAVLHRVIVHEGSIGLQLNLGSLVLALLNKPLPGEVRERHAQTFCLKVPFRHIPQGSALRLVIENRRDESSASREAIVKAIARARAWYELIVIGKATGLPDLARQHGLTHRYLKNIFPLAFLSPESIELLLNRRDDIPRTLESLMGKVPMRWDAQKAYLGEV